MKNSKMVVLNTTCFAEHEKRQLPCLKDSCKQWLDNSDSYNCSILLAKNSGALKQEIVGNLLGLTRMRVCQIEKMILYKIKTAKEVKDMKKL